MAKIQADRNVTGLHTADHNYQKSPLGKYGGYEVKTSQGSTSLKATKKPSIVKNAASRFKDILPGQNGKVRRFNRKQKELSRKLGNLLGRVGTAGDVSTIPKRDIVKNLRSMRELGNSMDAKIDNYDHATQLEDALNAHLDVLEADDVALMVELFEQVNIDDGMQFELDRIRSDNESVNVPSAITQSQIADITPQLTEELDLLKQDLEIIRDAVANHQFAQQTGLSRDVAKAARTAGISVEDATALKGSDISPEHVGEFHELGLSTKEMSRLADLGRTPDDVSELTNAFATLGQDVSAAVLCVTSGMDTEAIEQLMSEHDLNETDAIRLAQADVNSEFLTTLKNAEGFSQQRLDDIVDTNIEINKLGWDRSNIGRANFDDQPKNQLQLIGEGAMAVTYKANIQIGGQDKEMFFSKEDMNAPDADVWKDMFDDGTFPDPPRMAQRNIASSKLDAKFEFNVIAQSEFGTLRDPDGNMLVGTWMTSAKTNDNVKQAKDITYIPTTDEWADFNQVKAQLVEPEKHGGYLDENNQIDFPQLKSDKGQQFQFSVDGDPNFDRKMSTAELENCDIQMREVDVVPHNVSVSTPSLQKSVTRMQYMDFLAGQLDRSSANYFIDNQNPNDVKVIGIDNDLAWGTHPSSEEDVNAIMNSVMHVSTSPHRMVHLPPVADAETVQKFASMTEADLEDMLGDLLTTEEVDAAKARLGMIKKHLENLPQDCILGNWDNAQASQKFLELADEHNSYLIRDEALFSPRNDLADNN